MAFAKLVHGWCLPSLNGVDQTSGAWLACTVDPRALEKSEEDFHEFVLLIYRKASNTRCWVSMTERHMSFADDHLLAELGKEGTSFTDMATMCVIKVTAME